MGILKVIGWILKLPLILLVFLTIGLGFYAASGMLQGFRIQYYAPIALSIIVFLYIIGTVILSIKNKTSNKETTDDSKYTLDDEEYDAETKRALAEYEEYVN